MRAQRYNRVILRVHNWHNGFANAREVKCPEGSFYRQYPQLCEQTCEKPEIVECNPADKNNGPFGCRCDRQHVRHNGICITPDKCPKPCK
ncbi:hypothetical protein HCN44_008055 [Aphidius gifuensis]|uniref:Uncharacterized protein n=1 Tax=Aphidius gifuensis TaxID=684658 RepID=A0A834XMC1_APHGI|nr:hypothetical protein HCN44_008055 [Aphidius gifuensis]